MEGEVGGKGKEEWGRGRGREGERVEEKDEEEKMYRMSLWRVGWQIRSETMLDTMSLISNTVQK